MSRWVRIVHSLPGRARLRVSAIRNQREECAAAARAVAALPGVALVRADPFTGSFLVRYDEATVDALALASTVRDAVEARGILLAGERPPLEHRDGPAQPSAIGRALYQVFRDLNEELPRRTGGGIDLGVLTTAAFFTFGAAEVISTRKIPPPPWFNMAWWGFQTFLSSEGGGLQTPADRDGAPAPQD